MSSLERFRKLASWLAISVFTVSFVALLGLSASDYWTAENPLVNLCDRAWRISGLVALALGAIPYLQWALLHLAALLGIER